MTEVTYPFRNRSPGELYHYNLHLQWASVRPDLGSDSPGSSSFANVTTA